MTDYEAISTFAVTLLGSGVGSSLIGIWFKKHFDAELEKNKAALQRGGRVHERQVDALLQLYSELEHAQFFLSRGTSSGVFEGENREDLIKKAAEHLAAAGKLYSQRKLLIPQPLATNIDELFELVQSARVSLSFAMWELTSGPDKAEFWKRAQDTVHQKLPSVLKAIEKTARETIHSER